MHLNLSGIKESQHHGLERHHFQSGNPHRGRGPYYQEHALTLARHPSETDERMMVRLLAFALHAHEALSFGRGVSVEEEPALWLKDLTGSVDLWIE